MKNVGEGLRDWKEENFGITLRRKKETEAEAEAETETEKDDEDDDNVVDV